MKKKAGYFTLIIISIIYFSYLNTKERIDLELNDNNITELREQHVIFLANSPFKETLKLSKTERKAIQLPPNKYYEREWELTMNPSIGKPEPNKVLELQKKLNDKSVSFKAPGDGSVGNDWVDRGPNNVGGRTRVVLFDPNDLNSQRVYAGGVSGGLWVNQNITDVNSIWTLVADVPSNMNISCITVDPNNSNIWYLGTGEQYTAGAAVGNGVYKTTNGGLTWTKIQVQLAGVGNLSAGDTDTFLAGIYYINDIIAWDNGISTEVFIGVGGHLYGDASNPNNWLGLQSAGIYKTVDDGLNWNRMESLNMNFKLNSFDFYFIPNDFEISADNTLWMGTIGSPGVGGDGGGRIFSSTDGVTWTEATDSPLSNSNRVELAVSSTDADKLYALTQGTTTGGPHIFSTNNGFGTSTGVSGTFELAKPNDADTGIPANDFTRGQDFYNLVIEVDPTNDDVLYVGGIDLFRTDQGSNTNLASEWKQISKWSNNNNLGSLNSSLVHADQHAFTFRPGNNNQAVIGCDGGVYYANDLLNAETTSVFTVMNTNYNVTQFYFGGYGQNTTNELILAGAQDNGSQFIEAANAGENPSIEVFGGDGAYSTIDKDGDYMIASYVYSNHVYFNLPYTNNGYLIDENDDEGDFINVAGLDHNLNIMYSNGSSTTKQINRYTLESSSANKEQLTNVLLDGSPTAFKVSPFTTQSSTLLVGTENGKLLKLTNTNQALENVLWRNISGNSFIGSVSSIEFGETENDIFVTFHNYGVVSIWYTSNGGETWKNKEGDLPDMPVKCFLQNPLAKNEVIIGTELGIWASKNFNEDTPNWVRSNNGMRDVKVVDLDLRLDDNSILATTFGRGTFTGKFASETNPTFLISSQNSVLDGCNTGDIIFNFNFTANGGYNTVTNLSASGQPAGTTINFSQNSLSTTSPFTMTIGNTESVVPGTYVITVTGTGSKIISTDVVLEVNEPNLDSVTTIQPSNAAIGVEIKGSAYTWNAIAGATSYTIDIASDSAFNNIIETNNTSLTSYISNTLLNLSTVYYWRVQSFNSCTSGDYSGTKNFQTVPLNNCNTQTNNTIIPIPDFVSGNTSEPAISQISVPNSFIISDVNISLNISHTCIGDVVISLISPNNTEIVLFDNECWNPCMLDMDVTYDDEAFGNISCSGPISGVVKPTNSFAGFNGENAQGNWSLKVVDGGPGDSGTINSWSIEICEAEQVNNSSFINNTITVGPNSSHIINSLFIEAFSNGSTASQQVFMISEMPLIGEIELNNVALLLGEIFTQEDINTLKLSYVNVSNVSDSDSFKVDITNETGGFLSNQQINFIIDTQYINNDTDEDGVNNNIDECPNTPIGKTVDITGCTMFTLPTDNFEINVTGETCPNEDNGKITVVAQDETLNYSTSINGVTYNFNNTFTTEANLVGGATYDFCITVIGEGFEQCYNVIVEEVAPVFGKIDVKDNKASVEIENGTAPFSVYINGNKAFTTGAPVFSLDVKHGDLIEVKTAKSCEGVYSKTVELFDEIVAYPNPTKGLFEISLPVIQKEVKIEIYNIESKLISSKNYAVTYGKVQLNIDDSPAGIYIVKLHLDTPVELKILKD